ncbi:MAG: N-acetylmuramoyl-L-alanine amidase [Bacteroidota bacterium]
MRNILLSVVVFMAGSAMAQTPKYLKTIIVDAGHGGKDYGAHGGYEGGLKSYEKNVTLAISNKLIAELRKQLPEVKVVPTRTTDIYQSPPEKADIANNNKGDLFICVHADAVALQTGRRQIGTRQETRYKVKGKGKKKKKTPYTVTVPVYEYYKIPSKRTGTSVWLFAAHKTGSKTDAILKNEAEHVDEEIEIGSGADSALNEIDFSGPEYRMMAQVHAKRYQEKSIKLADFINEEIAETDRPALGTLQRAKGIWVLQATNMPAVLVETGFITNYNDERYLNSDKGQQEIAECITRAVKQYKAQLEKGNLTAPSATGDSTKKEEAKVLKEAKGSKVTASNRK